MKHISKWDEEAGCYVHQTIKISNTVEAPVKSAVLKGNTLINLAPKRQTNKVYTNYSSGNVSFFDAITPIKQMKRGCTYTILFEVSDLSGERFAPILYEGRTTENVFFKYTISTGFALKNGINSVVFTTMDNVDIKHFFMFSYNTFQQGGGATFLGNSVMLLEGDYSNVDIQYFEGMQSVEISALKTSNSDSSRTNILTTNEDVILRSNGDVYDELDLSTGKLTHRINEDGDILSQEVVETVGLTLVDQDGKTISKLNSFNGTTHISTEVTQGSVHPTVAVEVAVE